MVRPFLRREYANDASSISWIPSPVLGANTQGFSALADRIFYFINNAFGQRWKSSCLTQVYFQPLAQSLYSNSLQSGLQLLVRHPLPAEHLHKPPESWYFIRKINMPRRINQIQQINLTIKGLYFNATVWALTNPRSRSKSIESKACSSFHVRKPRERMMRSLVWLTMIYMAIMEKLRMYDSFGALYVTEFLRYV